MGSDYEPLIEALREAFAEGLKCIVLFGSRARGEAHARSDHDLLVVAEGLPKDPVRRQRTITAPLLPLLDRVPGPIAFVAKTPGEFEADISTVVLDACVDGICLWGASYFEPWRRRALDALRESGLRRERLGRTSMWVFPGKPPRDWELTWDGYRERR